MATQMDLEKWIFSITVDRETFEAYKDMPDWEQEPVDFYKVLAPQAYTEAMSTLDFRFNHTEKPKPTP